MECPTQKNDTNYKTFTEQKVKDASISSAKHGEDFAMPSVMDISRDGVSVMVNFFHKLHDKLLDELFAKLDAIDKKVQAYPKKLRMAVHTIMHGNDFSASKPGPRPTPAKQRQIEAAKAWRKNHAGCTLHNACIRSFVPAKGGYKSAKTMYVVLKRKSNN